MFEHTNMHKLTSNRIKMNHLGYFKKTQLI